MKLKEIIIKEIQSWLKESQRKNRIIFGRDNKIIDIIPLTSDWQEISEKILFKFINNAFTIAHYYIRYYSNFDKIFLVFAVKFSDPTFVKGYKLFIIEKNQIGIYEILEMEEKSEVIEISKDSLEDDFLKTLQKIQKLIP